MQLISRWHPRNWFGPLLVAVVAWCLVAVSLDPGGDAPNWPAGPGVTLDESFNVQQGVYLVRSVGDFADGKTLKEIFTGPEYLPDHPPLGRLWLGAAHEFVGSLRGVETPAPEVRLFDARFGSATAYAMMILIVGWVVSVWSGPGTGFCTGLAMLVMPRLFGHAHLAALETVTNFFFTLAALGIATWWTKESPPTKKGAIFCGLLWGLAMLTKIQGVLLMVPVGIWGLCYWRKKAIVPGVLFGIAGFATLLALWPWLWFDPVGHLGEYLGRTTDRTVNKVYYLGHVFVDHIDATRADLAGYEEIPWHYPAVMFLVTVPLGFQILGAVGLLAKREGRRFDGRTQFLLATMLFPLVLFALPGVAVYDGVRLFLMSFPLWGIVIGRGGAVAWEWISARSRNFGKIVWGTVFLGAQVAAMFSLQPCQLSYYSFAVGSLRGAETLGFEVSYWGDTLHRDFQRQVVEAVGAGSRVGVVPVLHQFQIVDLREQSLVFREHEIELVPFDPTHTDRPEYVMTFSRKADHSELLTETLAGGELLAEFRRQGVLLAGLYRVGRE